MSRDSFLRAGSDGEPLSLRLPGDGLDHQQSRTGDFGLLLRHFLNRFFNNELMSQDGESKTRLVQLAVVAGLPGFVMALYLYSPYHPLFGGVRPHWLRVSDHYFYCLYSLVATGVLTIFAWDFFFPDLLDTYTIGTLPLRPWLVFRARVTAVAILLSSFLFDSNFLAPLILPAATEPPHLGRFLLAHVAAVSLAGIFASAFVLALQGSLLTIFGERLFRKLSPLLQTVFVFVLLTLLFLYSSFYSQIQHLVQSSESWTRCIPPLWFLGIYQRVLEGQAADAEFFVLAKTGCWATLIAVLVATAFYPLAYRRRVRGLIEGTTVKTLRSSRFSASFLAAFFLKKPQERAIWHFISQTILGVPRYRIYLSLYGGTGLALVASSVLRIQMGARGPAFAISDASVQAVIPIVAFWMVSGLRMTFQSPADLRSAWVFEAIHGAADQLHLQTAQRWTFCWSLGITLASIGTADSLRLGQSLHWNDLAAQFLVACGLCLLLTDAFFLKTSSIPFTFLAPETRMNLAFVLIPYLAVFPAILTITFSIEPWIAAGVMHLCVAGLAIGMLHVSFSKVRARLLADQLEDSRRGEHSERYPLGLRSM